MKLVYYESSEVDAAVVLTIDGQDMNVLDGYADDMLTNASRAGEIEIDDDTAKALERAGMSLNRLYIG